jgi:glucose dehydrogenase
LRLLSPGPIATRTVDGFVFVSLAGFVFVIVAGFVFIIVAGFVFESLSKEAGRKKSSS